MQPRVLHVACSRVNVAYSIVPSPIHHRYPYPYQGTLTLVPCGRRKAQAAAAPEPPLSRRLFILMKRGTRSND